MNNNWGNEVLRSMCLCYCIWKRPARLFTRAMLQLAMNTHTPADGQHTHVKRGRSVMDCVPPDDAEGMQRDKGSGGRLRGVTMLDKIENTEEMKDGSGVVNCRGLVQAEFSNVDLYKAALVCPQRGNNGITLGNGVDGFDITSVKVGEGQKTVSSNLEKHVEEQDCRTTKQ